MQSTDFFVAKFDGDGNEIWVHDGGGSGNDSTLNVKTAPDGSIYIVGYFSSQTMNLGSYSVTNAGGIDIFIAKYNAAGSVQWLKSFGGSGYEQTEDIAIDGSGNIYIAGYYGSPELSFGSFTLENQGINDIFVVKMDPDGNPVWAVSEGGDMFEGATAISVKNEGEVYITGYFGTDEIQFGDTTLTNTGVQTIFITKYNSDGTVAWAKAGQGSSMDMSTGILVDDSGNLYSTGYMDSPSVNFDGIILNNNGGNDIYLVQYTSDGEIVFAENYGGSGTDAGRALAKDANGNILITGDFSSSSVSFGDHSVYTSGGADIFIAKIDAGMVGVDDVFQTQLSLFPNPSNGIINIENNTEIEKISVFNLQGKLILETAVGKEKAEIDMSSFANGVYMMNIQSGNYTVTKKVVLAR